MGGQSERRVLGQAQLDTRGAGGNHPSAGGLALGLDVAAAGLGLQRAVHVVQVKTAGTGFGAHRTWRGLLQGEGAAAGFAVEASCHAGGVNGSAAGGYPEAASVAVNVYFS